MNGRSMFFPYSCRMFGSKCPQQSSNLTNTLVMEKLNTIQVSLNHGKGGVGKNSDQAFSFLLQVFLFSIVLEQATLPN
jgi:hypothetical protein